MTSVCEQVMNMRQDLCCKCNIIGMGTADGTDSIHIKRVIFIMSVVTYTYDLNKLEN
jgi:hypothetical protein